LKKKGDNLSECEDTINSLGTTPARGLMG